MKKFVTDKNNHIAAVEAPKKTKEMDNEMANLISVHTCSTCNHLFHLTRKLFDEATALRRCNHIFCWKCLHDKITQQNWQLCPVCFVDDQFGPDPLRRLSHEDELIDMEDYDEDDDDEDDEDDDYEDDEDDDDMDMDENVETACGRSNDKRKESTDETNVAANEKKKYADETNMSANEKKESDNAEDMEM